MDDLGRGAGPVRSRDSEKITINLGFVDLGRVDLLVENGLYANRTDLIRTAIRNQLERHENVLQAAVDRKRLEIGLRRVTRAELEALRAECRQVRLHVLGLVAIADDVTPELASETIASLVVLGALQASPRVKQALAGRLA